MPVLRYWDVASNSYISLGGLPGAGPTGPPGPTGPVGPPGTTVSFRAWRNAAYSYTGTGTNLPCDTVNWNTGGGGYNTGTGLYTCPVAGEYRVTFQSCVQATGANQFFGSQILHNGSTTAQSYAAYAVIANQYCFPQVNDSVQCAAGDTLVGNIWGSTALAGIGGTGNTYIAIDLITAGVGPTGPTGPAGALGQVISMRAHRNAAINTPTTSTNFVMDVTDWDTNSAYNNSTGVFTCPTAGKYKVNFTMAVLSTAANQYIALSIVQNGGSQAQSYFYSANASNWLWPQINATLNCSAGDTIGMQINSSAALQVNTSFTNTYLTVDLLSGTGPTGPTGAPGTPGPAVSVRAYRSTAWTIPTAAAVLPFDTEQWDTRSAYNTSTGLFTCPVAGYYRVSGQIDANATAASQYLAAEIYKNGNPVSNQWTYSSAASQYFFAQVVDTVNLAVGDTVGIYAMASVALALNQNAMNTYLTIDLVNSGPGPTGAVGPTGATGPAGNMQKFTAVVAAPTAGSPNTVVHGLNTATPFVQVYDNVTNQLVEVQVTVVDVNTITITVAQNMPNAITVAVTGGVSNAQTYMFSYTQTLLAPTVVNSPYIVTHNLSTLVPVVQIYDALTNVQLLAQVRVVDANNVAISVSANMPNNVNVVVMGQAPAPAPSQPSNLATKAYVDNMQLYADLGTTAPLPTYTVSGGSLAVLTATANGQLTVDTWNPYQGWKVLVKDENNTVINGLYQVTQTGSSTTPWILTEVVNAPSLALCWINTGGSLASSLWIQSTQTGSSMWTPVSGSGSSLPPPLTGSVMASWLDPAGDTWIAKGGVNGGVYKRATSVIHTKVYRSAAMTVAAGTWTGVGFDAITDDAYGCFTTTNWRFNCPVAGRYLVFGQVNGSPTVNPTRFICSIYKNGGEASRGLDITTSQNPSVSSCTDTFVCAANDYFSIYCYYSSAAPLVVGSALTNRMTVDLIGT